MQKFNNAIKLGTLISFLMKLFRFEGTSLPGKIIQKYYPNFLIESNKYILSPKYAITGTNGKTTTSTVLSDVLEKRFNEEPVNNKLGANMPNGIITAIAKGLNSKKYKSAVLEVDEAYFPKVSKDFKFDYLIITNLFRDQLDRYGEMDIARRKIIEGIRENNDITLVLNADDPSLSEISKEFEGKRKIIYYGINSIFYDTDCEQKSNSPKEGIICPYCGKNIMYDERYYAQVGLWHCECSNKRQTPDIKADIKVAREYSELFVEYENKKYAFKTSLTGLYNAYNVLGAISGALINNIEEKEINEALLNYKPVFGRHQKIPLKNGGKLTVHLIKNPVGASEVLRGLKNLKNTKLLISINDNYADGRDVSWLWDVDFESLKNFQNTIYTTGLRSYDMALRLKYTGFNLKNLVIMKSTKHVSRDVKKAIRKLKKDEDLTVLVTYTGLLEINKHIPSIK